MSGTEHFVLVFPSAPVEDTDWHWHKKARNGEIVADGEGYSSWRNGVRGAFEANPEIEEVRVYRPNEPPHTITREQFEHG